MAELHGSCDDRLRGLQDVLSRQLDDGTELGASVAVVVDGEMVADFWGGWADEARTRPWERDTIVNVWSTTKTMTNLSALVLADRGELDLDAPVADYWPEFAANGKEGVLVRHFLAHTSGVSGFAETCSADALYDWDSAVARFAAQAPFWEPGTASGYHALNQGHLVGEVIRRVSGRSLKQFFAEEIAGPLGADFQIGCRPEDDARVTPVLPPPPLPIDFASLDPTSPMFLTFTGPIADANDANTEGWRRADIGAANGHGNARSVAQVQAVVSNDGVMAGVQLLSPKTIDRIFEVQADGVDLVLGAPLRFGIGYGLPQPELLPYLPEGRVCFWGGWGGSVVVNDVDRHVTLAYMMNKMGAGIIGGSTAEGLVTELYRAL